jgi:cation diffusion facilitator CzcD-associated flavoprotein CzcO
MTSRTARISIVGGGLSGLYAAFLLDQQGIHDWVLLESRATLGGGWNALTNTRQAK